MATDPAQPLSPSDRARAAEAGVTRWLTGRMPPTPADELRDLADVVEDLGADPGARTGARAEAGADMAAGVGADAGAWDRYGDHGPVAALEARLADLLGKPAVAAFPSGSWRSSRCCGCGATPGDRGAWRSRRCRTC